MNMRSCLAGILAVAGAFGLAACGGGGGSTPPAINVTITTDVSNIETFQTVQFAAAVTGTSNTAVTWQLTCNALPTSACGTISASGLYVAPNTVPTVVTTTQNSSSTDPATLTVTAISQANSNAGDSVGFTIDSLNMQPYTAPVPLGSSGGNANAICLNPAPGFCFGGTLGSLLAISATPQLAPVILSNNHVLGLSDGGTAGQEVTQPGVIETNCSLVGTINVATVATIINLQTQPAPPVDVTTATITSGQVDTTGSILELGVVTNGVPQPAPPAAGTGNTTTIGKLLAKSGRTTGLTCANVESVALTMLTVDYSQGCATGTSFSVAYNDEIEVGNMPNGQSFIGDGDSGSLAVDAATAEPVALMFAGNGDSAVGNPVADVLNALHTSTGHTYSFVGGAQHTVPGCQLPGLSNVKVTPQSAISALPAGTVQRAQAAAASYSTQIMNTPGVSAYGGGGSLDAPNEPAVLIFARPGASHAGIPLTIDGVRTRIIESNSASVHGPLSTQQSEQIASESVQAQAIEIPASAIAQTKSVKEQHVKELMSDPSVIGVGVSASLDNPGDPAVMIFVLKGKAHQAIPASIDGVRTRIKETSPFRANVAHPLKSTAAAAGCHVPKNAPATTLNSAPVAPPQPSASSPSASVQPIGPTTTHR
jgi:hypothetical protein